MIDFTNIAYLQYGSAAQRGVFNILQKSQLITHLAPFTPLVAGTFPLDIQVAGSDVDIVCYAQNSTVFEQAVTGLVSSTNNFTVQHLNELLSPAILFTFSLDGVPFEIFGQNIPSHLQNAYRHMLIEHKILIKEGDNFKRQIIALKQQGIKTEPAFCQLLGLSGNPYQVLLNYNV